MKLEMGESLIASWLKHEFGCQIVQTNWKPSSNWEFSVETKHIDILLKGLKKSFANLDLDFTSKKMKANQLITQGEVDCLGLFLSLDNTPGNENSNRLHVEKIYAVDVAFHEGGLNYGHIDVTCARIRKKYIRTALSIYQYFGTKEADFIFASPVVLKSHQDKLKQVAVDVKAAFDDLGFNFQFNLFCNEDFNNVIYNPVIEKSKNISDTSELFVRSIKLARLMNGIVEPRLTEELSLLKQQNKNKQLAKVTYVKIGITAQKAFRELEQTNALTAIDLEYLCDSQYSFKNLGVRFPILLKVTDEESIGFINGRRRYYGEPLLYLNQQYLLSNYWFDDNRHLLEKWLTRFQN